VVEVVFGGYFDDKRTFFGFFIFHVQGLS